MNFSSDACETLSMVEASQHFRYFVVDRSILLGVLEDSFFSEDEPPPTVRKFYFENDSFSSQTLILLNKLMTFKRFSLMVILQSLGFRTDPWRDRPFVLDASAASSPASQIRSQTVCKQSGKTPAHGGRRLQAERPPEFLSRLNRQNSSLQSVSWNSFFVAQILSFHIWGIRLGIAPFSNLRNNILKLKWFVVTS